jgi:hypothetical protein
MRTGKCRSNTRDKRRDDDSQRDPGPKRLSFRGMIELATAGDFAFVAQASSQVRSNSESDRWQSHAPNLTSLPSFQGSALERTAPAAPPLLDFCPLVPRLCLGTHCTWRLRRRWTFFRNVFLCKLAKPPLAFVASNSGGAATAVRSKAEPWNEIQYEIQPCSPRSKPLPWNKQGSNQICAAQSVDFSKTRNEVRFLVECAVLCADNHN